jgi:micrococcal nuclease
MKRILILFTIISSLIYAGPSLAASGESLPKTDFPDLRLSGHAVVEQVIDPLTYRLEDKRIIRLTGIEIPDLGGYKPGPLAITAQGIVKDMIEGKSINIYVTKKDSWGRYDRLERQLAHIERKNDKAWIQGTLLTLGLARVMTESRNPEMAAPMLKNEMRARGEKIGLWADEAYKVFTPEESSTQIGKTAIIEGRVRSVTQKNNRIYINFGEDWKTDFTAVISPEDRKAFFKNGNDPIRWNGRTIRVRGWVGERNGPFIEIDHPERVEFLEQDNTALKLKDYARPPMVSP